MNHSFTLSVGDNKCAKCHRLEIDHTDFATCETCSFIGNCELFSFVPSMIPMLMCQTCIEKDKNHMSSENQASRLSQFKLETAKQIDNSIKLRSDIFNAETVSIVELKRLIDDDQSILNKHFHLAQLVTDRMNGYKKAIFEKNEELVELSNKQQSTQVYLNELSNKLRLDEREQLKLKDINYKPNPTKISKPKGQTVRRFDKTEIRKYALLVGVPEAVLQMVCVAKNMTPEQAMHQLKSAMTKTP